MAVEGDSGLTTYLDNLKAIPLLSSHQEAELIAMAKTGNIEARNQLITAHLRFVVSIAGKYKGCGVPFADLISAGNSGLIRAIGKFDSSHKVKFISYGVWWIRLFIQQALYDHSRVIRQPWHRVGTFKKIGRFSNDFGQEHGRFPSSFEISEGLELDEDHVVSLQLSNQSIGSLDKPINEDGSPLLTLLANSESELPDQLVSQDNLREKMDRVISTLPAREARIVRLFFGLGEDRKTLQEIGQMVGVSRERIRQIKESALKKLRKKCLATRISLEDIEPNEYNPVFSFLRDN